LSPIIATVVEEVSADVLQHVEAVRLILEEDVFEDVMAEKLRAYWRDISDIEMASAVFDALAKYKVISKAKFRELYGK
jgi:hypothetical protein